MLLYQLKLIYGEIRIVPEQSAAETVHHVCKVSGFQVDGGIFGPETDGFPERPDGAVALIQNGFHLLGIVIQKFLFRNACQRQ